MRKKYLVTGGAGFIGSNLIEKIISQGDEVVVVGRHLPAECKEDDNNLKDNITFYQADVTYYEFMEQLLIKEKFDYIVLLAAVISISGTIAEPLSTHFINQEAILYIYEIIRKNKLKVKKVLFTSSSAVYGNIVDTPRREDMPVSLENPYAIDKFASERYAMFYEKVYGIPTVAVRFFNVYGPRQKAQGKSAGVCAIILDCLLNDKEFRLNGDGKQTRDYMYVTDAVDATLMLLKDPQISGKIFNVASGKSVSLIDLIVAFEEITGKKLKIIHNKGLKFDTKNSLADITKLEKTGFLPKYTFESGLRQYVKEEKRRLGYS
ncbi:SDR family NAD(P)-dependent oxidoreductase [Ligilactobacillus salivarius]|uniref:SDR family NAD(P)-dependent oxidoreductase n=1 Tax=Ligilactobacillus salivarius TaxID=1624 RepID=UPI001367CC43|nr:SDR family NAD(P)-dependent oxidoreductase [Ligilactobacillus salivarius]MYY50139.1 SDR family NAD(P)-dependent oxidoreductase [Ligilactobacillus salivarius]